jgi:hypothetical protein
LAADPIVVGRWPATTPAVARDIGADHFRADVTRLDDVHVRGAGRARSDVRS